MAPCFPTDIQKARELQETLRKEVQIIPLCRRPENIAGVDAAFSEGRVIAVASLFSYPELMPIHDEIVIEEVTFPYVPGFLSFREGPAMIKAIHRLKIRPDVIIFDGQGIAHPLGLGIASHIGVILNIPTIGCAKSRLIGNYREPGMKKGSRADLIYQGKRVGIVLRSRDNVRPIFVSPGHLITFEEAVEIVLNCTGRFRIPEPLRRADSLSRKIYTS